MSLLERLEARDPISEVRLILHLLDLLQVHPPSQRFTKEVAMFIIKTYMNMKCIMHMHRTEKQKNSGSRA